MGKSKKSHKHKSKKSKKEKKHKRRSSSSSLSSTSSFEDEWVEKKAPSESTKQKREIERDEWLSLPTHFSSTSHLDRRKEREEKKQQDKISSTYNPSKSARELNPYWKDGGDGLPKFKKPVDDEQDSSKSSTSYGRWKKKSSTTNNFDSKDKFKKPTVDYDEGSSKSSTSIDFGKNIIESHDDKILTDKELNLLASKLVKAEIMGNESLAKELREKLERMRGNVAKDSGREEVILSRTDSKGFTTPLKQNNPYGESSGSNKKKQKVETHVGNDRVRYFPDDDKCSLKEMFENEKYNSIEEQNAQFLKLAGKIRKNDDLDDVFADNIRRKESDEKADKRSRDQAINEHKRMTETLDNCNKCVDSSRMPKHLLITVGEHIYLALPEFQPLTEGHCLIAPVRHISCATQLDENEWSELMHFRRLLTKMFLSQDKDVIFFENAKNLNRYPHMYIECVPVEKEIGDEAPIYFKKAIDESEREWSNNKKLVNLAGRDVRRAVPKGLPYFAVSFGMQEGYAHIIEDKLYFPDNFAQEIIGGMLDLPHGVWRKRKQEDFDKQSKRVLEFTKVWKDYRQD